jgi:hypothetical protein
LVKGDIFCDLYAYCSREHAVWLRSRAPDPLQLDVDVGRTSLLKLVGGHPPLATTG